MRLRLDCAYDGTDFSGWAAQPGLRTVEGVLTEGLSTVLRVAEPVRLVVAGRTDAGVHARGQVVHVDVPDEVYAAVVGRSAGAPADALATRLRGILPPDLALTGVREAPAGFDARFSAIWRRYRYRLCDDPAALDPLRRRDTVLLKGPLHREAMNAAARELLGLHDFAAFCRRREGATTIRTLTAYRWERAEDGTLEAEVQADAFCHSMVRALVGAAVAVGQGRLTPAEVGGILMGGTRDGRVKVMPAHGLSLEEVAYPADDLLAARAAQARSRRENPVAAGDSAAAG